MLPPDGTQGALKLTDGREIVADLVIPATGQTPNNGFVKTLEPSTDDPLLNPSNGFIKVRPTLQFKDPAYSNLFAAGDIADSGAHKAARPGAAQAQVVAKNIVAMVEGREPTEKLLVTPPGIHLSLGLVRTTPSETICPVALTNVCLLLVQIKNMVFRNPNVAAGETEPTVMMRDE